MQFDFSKNNVVDAIEAVPQDFRGLYSENANGKFELRSDDDGVKSAVAAIQRMNGALIASRNEVSDLRKAKGVDLSPLEEFGGTPEEIANGVQSRLDELHAQLEGSKNKKSSEEIQAKIDKIKADLMAAHKAEVEKLSSGQESVKSQLFETLISDAATREIVSQGGDPELLMPFVAPSLRPVEVDGKYQVRVVDDAGDVRYSGVTGGAMDIKERVAEIKSNEKFGKFFASDSPNGGGARASARSPNPVKRSEMTANQKIAEGLRKGQATGTGSGYAR